MIQEAYVQGISTRSVDELVKALGMSGVSRSQVSRLCAEIDERVATFLERPLEGDWPYLWIDATYLKVRQNGRIVSVVVCIAVAVNSDGRREVFGMAENERVCDAPQTKRFIVQTPLTTGANDAVDVAEQRLTVSAEGQSARDAAGNARAAYDPAQPVAVRFTMVGGGRREASGTLPLQHALVLNENEYHFTLRPGAEGFAILTAERCDYP